jgi:hypothetical protein
MFPGVLRRTPDPDPVVVRFSLTKMLLPNAEIGPEIVIADENVRSVEFPPTKLLPDKVPALPTTSPPRPLLKSNSEPKVNPLLKPVV